MAKAEGKEAFEVKEALKKGGIEIEEEEEKEKK
jgi:hypothetical protein